ncbi:MAG: hypothetical protein KC731_32855 [Myxococcales bacterium]|nr:hypothetical protein [Myxococcales bacterium]
MRSAFLVAAVVAVSSLGCSSSKGTAGGGGSGAGGGGTGGQGGSAVSYPEPFTITAFDDTRITSQQDQPNFQTVDAPIDWGEGPFAEVRLIVDLDTTCYPFEKWQSNPPPAGENFPADCDAFDRNYEWSLKPATDDGAPTLELIRAITPFGGPLHIEEDITDIANYFTGARRLSSHITTWSDGAGMVSGSNGGWNVSARIEVTPGPAPREVLKIESLHYGSMQSGDLPASRSLEIPEGTSYARVDYRVTGHGGGPQGINCIGPADEFCRRTHVITVDGQEAASFIPWRDDCADLCTVASYGTPPNGFDYCMENPTGNMQSVRAPRANWCPGSVTPAIVLDPAALRMPGMHSFDWNIENVADGGSWKVSATLFAYANL